MTLGRRALLLIFPVVLAGYALAASIVYFAETSSIRRLEETRLQQRAVNLGVTFRSELALNRSQIASIIGTEALRLFLAEMDNSYRAGAVTLRLRESMRNMWDNPQAFVSLAIILPDGHLEYYYENSPDPFATAAAAQMKVAERLLGSATVNSWDYVDRDGERPLIVHSELIDKRTMTRPRASLGNDVALIQVAVRPDQFIAMRRAMEAEYGVTAEFLAAPPPETGSSHATVELGPALFLSIRFPEAYIAGSTLRLKLLLAVGALLISMASVGLLIGLVQRFITRPVAKLDRQVTEVIAGRRDSIDESAGGGEISRLSVNMKRLYDELTLSIQETRNAALTDPLTGLGNRLSFNAAITAAIETAEADCGVCTMLFLDVDNFKFVNDRYGHKAGDELLKTVAHRVGEVTAEVKRLHPELHIEFMRLSGDEFAILVGSPGPCEVAGVIATATLAIFRHGLDVLGEIYPVSVSIGVAAYPDNALSVAELIHNADAAMYEAKANGKNAKASFCATIGDTQRRAREIQDELRTAEMDEQFSLVYMPIIDTQGTVRRCEALLRWCSPKLGVVGPDEFIPIAERSGSFERIDRWVTERAIGEYARLAEWFGDGLVLAVNLSSAELRTGAIGEHIATCLAKHRVPPAGVEIELTETFAADKSATAGLASLRELGVKIAIDDFGAGHTSVRQLTDYDVDTIKLDRSLVEQLAVGDNQNQTLAALIALCHARGMLVVGEGVDTAIKRANLEAAGCDLLQGFGISPPLPLAELGTWHLQHLATGRGRERQGVAVGWRGGRRRSRSSDGAVTQTA